jgi:hypothetical protein
MRDSTFLALYNGIRSRALVSSFVFCIIACYMATRAFHVCAVTLIEFLPEQMLQPTSDR